MAVSTERVCAALSAMLNAVSRSISGSNEQRISSDSYTKLLKCIALLHNKTISANLTNSIEKLLHSLNMSIVEESRLFSLCLKLLLTFPTEKNYSRVWLNLNKSVQFLDKFDDEAAVSDLLIRSLSGDHDNWKATKLLILLVKKSKALKLSVAKLFPPNYTKIGSIIFENENFTSINYLIELVSVIMPPRRSSNTITIPFTSKLWPSTQFNMLYTKFPYTETGSFDIIHYLNEVSKFNEAGRKNFKNLYQLSSIDCKTNGGFSFRDCLMFLHMLDSKLILWKPESVDTNKLVPIELNSECLKSIALVKSDCLRLVFGADKSNQTNEFSLLSDTLKIKNIMLDVQLSQQNLNFKLMNNLKKFTNESAKRKVSVVQQVLFINTTGYDSENDNQIPDIATTAKTNVDLLTTTPERTKQLPLSKDQDQLSEIDENSSMYGSAEHSKVMEVPNKKAGRPITKIVDSILYNNNLQDNSSKEISDSIIDDTTIQGEPELQVLASEISNILQPKPISKHFDSIPWEINTSDIVTSTTTKAVKLDNFELMSSKKPTNKLNSKIDRNHSIFDDDSNPMKRISASSHYDEIDQFITSNKDIISRSSSALSGIDNIILPSSLAQNDKKPYASAENDNGAGTSLPTPNSTLKSLNIIKKQYGKGNKTKSKQSKCDIWDFSSSSAHCSPVASPKKQRDGTKDVLDSVNKRCGSGIKASQKLQPQANQKFEFVNEVISEDAFSAALPELPEQKKRGRPLKNKMLLNDKPVAGKLSIHVEKTVKEKNVFKEQATNIPHANLKGDRPIEQSISQLSEIPDSQFSSSSFINIPVPVKLVGEQRGKETITVVQPEVSISSIQRTRSKTPIYNSDSFAHMSTLSSPMIGAAKRAKIRLETVQRIPTGQETREPDTAGNARFSMKSPKTTNIKSVNISVEGSPIVTKSMSITKNRNTVAHGTMDRIKSIYNNVEVEVEGIQIQNKSKLKIKKRKSNVEVDEDPIILKRSRRSKKVVQYVSDSSDDEFDEIIDVTKDDATSYKETLYSVDDDPSTAKTSFMLPPDQTRDHQFAGFCDQMYQGLNLMSLSLVNRMKSIESEINEREQELKMSLDRKLQEVHESHQKNIEKFVRYVQELDSNVFSEKALNEKIKARPCF